MKALAAAATVVAVCLVAVAVQSQGPAVGSRAAQLLAAAHQDTLQYVYMPAAAAKDARARSAMLNALLTQSLDDKLGDGLGNNKSCAISSLVAQANFIFPHWDGCGYIHHSDSNKKGAVSGPAHDYFCGPDEMKMWPCNTKFVRTYKNDNPGNLGNCYARIPGLTQTCHYYRECGSRTHVSDWNKDVCESDTGDYYKEPEVQRMCGICDMFHAELADSRDTPDEFGKKKEGGCIADSGVVWRRDAGNATRAKVGELRVDDVVWTWQGWRRVYYIMAHRQPVATVRLAWEGGSVEVSRHHLLPVVKTALLAPGASEMACGTGAASLKAAADVAAGDAVLVPHPRMGAGTPASVCTLARVQQREERTSQVRYVLVEGDSLVVSGDADRLVEQTGGAVVSVFSSPLREWETRPFRALDAILPGSLQWAPVAIALEQALGSPMLLWAESVVRAVDKCVAHVHAPAGRRSGEGEQKAAPCMRCVGAGSGEWGKGVF